MKRLLSGLKLLPFVIRYINNKHEADCKPDDERVIRLVAYLISKAAGDVTNAHLKGWLVRQLNLVGCGGQSRAPEGYGAEKWMELDGPMQELNESFESFYLMVAELSNYDWSPASVYFWPGPPVSGRDNYSSES